MVKLGDKALIPTILTSLPNRTTNCCRVRSSQHRPMIWSLLTVKLARSYSLPVLMDGFSVCCSVEALLFLAAWNSLITRSSNRSFISRPCQICAISKRQVREAKYRWKKASLGQVWGTNLFLRRTTCSAQASEAKWWEPLIQESWESKSRSHCLRIHFLKTMQIIGKRASMNPNFR